MAVRLPALRAGSPLPPGIFLVLISVRGWVDSRATLRLEELGRLKNQITSSGMEHATFRLAAECLNRAWGWKWMDIFRVKTTRTENKSYKIEFRESKSGLQNFKTRPHMLVDIKIRLLNFQPKITLFWHHSLRRSISLNFLTNQSRT
jgi:hypothetical protein